MALQMAEFNDAIERVGEKERRHRRRRLAQGVMLALAGAAFLAAGLSVGGYIF